MCTAEIIDVDGDGHRDLVVGGHEFENMPTRIFWGAATPGYRLDRSTLVPAVAGQGIVLDLDAEDVDGDGRRDLVVNRTSSTPAPYQGLFVQLLLQAAPRSFVDATTARIPMNTAPAWVDWLRLQDLDGDGDPDLFSDDLGRDLLWENRSGTLVRR